MNEDRTRLHRFRVETVLSAIDTIKAILDNGRRLLDDADSLQFNEPPATAYFLTLTAQEEFAKAFLLELVARRVIPWSKHIHRATRDHRCKQLLAAVMDYLEPDVDEFIKRHTDFMLHPIPMPLPAKIADAINIFRHEKIRRWESSAWVWDLEPEYDPDAWAIGSGKRDELKQDALYIRLGSDGRAITPSVSITRHILEDEIDRAKRAAALVERLHAEPAHADCDYDRIEEAFRILFAPIPDDTLGPPLLR